jgi:hypothetical protein
MASTMLPVQRGICVGHRQARSIPAYAGARHALRVRPAPVGMGTRALPLVAKRREAVMLREVR